MIAFLSLMGNFMFGLLIQLNGVVFSGYIDGQMWSVTLLYIIIGSLLASMLITSFWHGSKG